jgi:DNA invertase Pin-like site-specific DNA recombinase
MGARSPGDDVIPVPQPVPVAIYTRVSTDNQIGGRFDSCESQAEICREHVQKHTGEGWYEVACYKDAAYSGGTMDRPGMKALKRQIEAGEVRVVLIFKLERVLRSTDEWVPFRAFLQKHQCRLESATEDLSESTPSGRLKNNLLMSVAEYERLNTAEKTRAKMLQQAKRGIWNGGYVPYGYAYDKNTQTLQPHPEESAVVRQVFEQAAKLVSLTDIANALNAKGLRTKERVMRRRDGSTETIGGRVFRSDGLRLMIQNPIYRGVVKFGGQVYAAKHPPLVPAETWDKANAAAAEKTPLPVRVFQERDAQVHLLKGLAYCGACGRALVPSGSGKKSVRGTKYRYYTCSLVMRESATAPCPVRHVSADALEQSVIALIGEASRHPTVISAMVEASRTMHKGDRELLRKELDQAKQTLASVDRQLNNCADAVAKGGAEVLGEALVRRASELRAERQRLLVVQERKRQELAACEKTVLEERLITENLGKLGQALPKLSPQERKELVRLFVERVEVRRVMPRVRRRSPVDTSAVVEPETRVMAIRIKLHLPELIQGMQERAAKASAGSRLAQRGLNLDGQVDFTNAQRGEVTVMAPFQQVLRIEERVRTVPRPKSIAEHPIIRAQKWHQMLQSGQVATRSALARKLKLRPDAITRILKLIELDPGIQAYLASLKSAGAIWHFGYMPMGKLAELPFGQQRAVFGKMRADYELIEQRNLSRQNTLSLPPTRHARAATTPRLSAG